MGSRHPLIADVAHGTVGPIEFYVEEFKRTAFGGV